MLALGAAEAGHPPAGMPAPLVLPPTANRLRAPTQGANIPNIAHDLPLVCPLANDRYRHQRKQCGVRAQCLPIASIPDPRCVPRLRDPRALYARLRRPFSRPALSPAPRWACVVWLPSCTHLGWRQQPLSLPRPRREESADADAPSLAAGFVSADLLGLDGSCQVPTRHFKNKGAFAGLYRCAHVLSTSSNAAHPLTVVVQHWRRQTRKVADDARSDPPSLLYARKPANRRVCLLTIPRA